jgi:hypothetical protein
LPREIALGREEGIRVAALAGTVLGIVRVGVLAGLELRFDNEFYLAANPDVKAAGLNPLAHYLANGQAEGRAIHDAVGRVRPGGSHLGIGREIALGREEGIRVAALAGTVLGIVRVGVLATCSPTPRSW